MALYQQDAASAIGAIEQYLNDYPEAPDYNDMTARLATAYYSAGDRGMVMALGEAVDMGMLSNSERDRLLIVEAMALIEAGDIEEADIRLRTLANLSDSYGDEVAFCSAYIDYAEGRYDDALTAFDHLASSAQDATLKSKAAFYEAELLLEEGRCDEATVIAIRLLDDGSLLSTAERTEALRIKGESLYGTADYADAATTLEDYLSTAAQPQRNALYKLAMSHFLNGDYGRAPEIFHMVIADEDEITQNALLHSALCQLENGSESEARLLFESAAAMDADRSVKEQAAHIRMARIALEQRIGREPSLSELSRETGISPEDIAFTETATGPAESLQREAGDDGFTLELVLGDYGAEERMVEHVALRAAVEKLPERERQVIALRYYHGMTQQSCARVLRVSQVQVSRLERRAVELLKEMLETE